MDFPSGFPGFNDHMVSELLHGRSFFGKNHGEVQTVETTAYHVSTRKLESRNQTK
jgi:hypothetical protein